MTVLSRGKHLESYSEAPCQDMHTALHTTYHASTFAMATWRCSASLHDTAARSSFITASIGLDRTCSAPSASDKPGTKSSGLYAQPCRYAVIAVLNAFRACFTIRWRT